MYIKELIEPRSGRFPYRTGEFAGAFRGQRQRARIAMALAQDTNFRLPMKPQLFWIAHRVEIMDLVKDLNQRHGKTIVLVPHDLNLAARYADDIVILKQGRDVVSGSPRDVLTSPILREMFSIEAYLVYGEDGGLLFCAPLGSLPEDVSA